ncbi:MAG TPA: PepSY domain-containing protein [Alphaproteobacteria bacterium]|nr:PepSY domain-containing protein [Alphaproteobacteria bacterium]
MSPLLRRRILSVHRWAGLIIGLIIAWMAITGAVMVFRPQLEPMAEHKLRTVATCSTHLPLDALADTARAAHPGVHLDYIRVLGGDAEPVLIRYADQKTAYLDPCTATVIGIQSRYGGPFGMIEWLHRFMFLGGAHGTITGLAVGAFALLLIVGGLVVWWPGTLKNLKPAIRLNTCLTGRARTLNRHRTIGLYASLVVLISALTGLPQAVDWYKNGIYWITGSPRPEAGAFKSDPASGAKRLPMEQFWQHARSLVPHPREALLHYPVKVRDPIEIYMIGADAPHANARTYLYLDAYSDKVLSFVPYADSSLGHKLYFWTLSIHTALAGGIAWQLLLLAGALAVPYLAWTGIGSYLRRKLPAIKAAANGTFASPRLVSRRAITAAVIALVVAASVGLSISPAEPQRPTRIILVVDGIKEVRNLPAIVAESLGYFKDEGLLVTMMDGRDEIPTDQMLVDGRADAAMAFYHHTIMSQASGKMTEAVVALAMSPAEKILVASRLKDQIKSASDLKGRKIFTGGPNSGKTITANWLMANAGFKATDYTRLELADRETMAKALADGDADAIVAHEPDASFYQKSGVGTVLADVTSVAETKKNLGALFPTTTLYLSNAYVAAHPDITQHLVNAMLRSLAFINSHTPEEIMAALPKQIAGKDPATYLHNLTEDVGMFRTDGLMPESDARIEMKIITDFQPKYASAKFEDTYTNRFVEAAPKRAKEP